jgi:predicted RNase H-like nuclease (RuvC/YqgF family)
MQNQLQELQERSVEHSPKEEEELREEVQGLRGECDRVKRENGQLEAKVRIMQQEMIKNCYSQDELATYREDNSRLRSRLEELEAASSRDSQSAQRAVELEGQVKQLIEQSALNQDEKNALENRLTSQANKYQL